MVDRIGETAALVGLAHRPRSARKRDLRDLQFLGPQFKLAVVMFLVAIARLRVIGQKQLDQCSPGYVDGLARRADDHPFFDRPHA